MGALSLLRQRREEREMMPYMSAMASKETPIGKTLSKIYSHQLPTASYDTKRTHDEATSH